MILLNELRQRLTGQLIPDDKLWYLLLDKYVHRYNDPTYFNKYTINGERTNEESDYLAAMTTAWHSMYSSVEMKKRLTPELLLELHAQCRPVIILEDIDVNNPYLSPDKLRDSRQKKISGFTGPGCYSFDNIGVTHASYTHISEAARKEWVENTLIFDYLNPSYYKNSEIKPEMCLLTPQQIRERFLAIHIPAGPIDSKIRAWINSMFEPLHTFYLSNPQFAGASQADIQMLNDHFNNFRIAEKNYNTIVSFSGLPVSSFGSSDEVIALATQKKRPQIENFIKQYYQDIETAADDNDKKLIAIARFIQKMSIFHAFTDCNQRLLVFIILNKLLMENNFMPVILDCPYIFDGYLSAPELVKEIQKGFDNFLQAVHPNLICDSAESRSEKEIGGSALVDKFFPPPKEQPATNCSLFCQRC